MESAGVQATTNEANEVEYYSSDEDEQPLSSAEMLRRRELCEEVVKEIMESGPTLGAGAAVKLAGKTIGLAKKVQKGGKGAEKASKASLGLMGKSFGKLSTVVKNPHISISDVSTHSVNSSITRALPSSVILDVIRNPIVVLRQSGGNYLYLTDQAAVVLNTGGRVVTNYPASMFKGDILKVLNSAK